MSSCLLSIDTSTTTVLHLSTHIQLVWFKKDLRIHDHDVLHAAALRGPVVCLYIYEPSMWQSPEYEESHLNFVNQSLGELRRQLRKMNGVLLLRHGDVVNCLTRLHDAMPFAALWSHEETGNMLSYKCDLAVKSWCKLRDIPWTELPQTGVIRRLKSRDGWAKTWYARMSRPIKPAPTNLHAPACFAGEQGAFRAPPTGQICTAKALGCAGSTKTEVQLGGESLAVQTLDSFLTSRGRIYRGSMSSPNTATTHCSRLSPYITWGNISVRSVYQQAQARHRALRESIKSGEQISPRWLKSMTSFSSRLRWHCHFMQKLEDQVDIEHRNLARMCDGLRVENSDDWSLTEKRYFDAWCAGRTGYPLVDAVMRSLHQTGWTNFRMRAMLISFASYHLWLHWRQPAIFLARHFLDFEAGIHFSQSQMQSGVTAINAIRIYSPIKQAQDQDPQGVFIRKYVPELANVPAAHVAEPHKMTHDEQLKYDCIIGTDYPQPIVDHSAAYQSAREKIYSARTGEIAKSEAKAIYVKHGSRLRKRHETRKKGAKRTSKRRSKKPEDKRQLSLFS